VELEFVHCCNTGGTGQGAGGRRGRGGVTLGGGLDIDFAPR